MVQQAYIHRLALGRSAFEPPVQLDGDRQSDDAAAGDDSVVTLEAINSDGYSQAYDSRGNPHNPASRAQLRRIIRAHNEVYATIGVCARVESSTQEDVSDPADSQPQDSDKAVMNENTIALWLIIAEELLGITVSAVSTSLRQRIQTFDVYSGIKLTDIFRIEISCQSMLQIFFAGEFAFRVSSFVWDVTDGVIDLAKHRLTRRFVDSQKNTYLSNINAGIIYSAEKLARLTVFCGLFPVQFYGSLQRLNLLPVWPLLPNLFSGAIFRLALPVDLLTKKERFTISWAIALATSPIAVFWGTRILTQNLQNKMAFYAQAVFPRPDNPDENSLKLVTNEIFDASDRVLNRSRYQVSLRSEVNKDIDSLREAFLDIGLQIRSLWRRHVLGKQPVVEFEDLMAEDEAAYVEVSPGRFVRTTDSYEPRRLPNPPASLIISDSATALTLDSPILTPTSSPGEENIDTTNASNVRIRARAGSTSTLHMDVEFTTTDEIGGPIHTSSFASSPNPKPNSEMSQAGSSSEQIAVHQAELTMAEPHFRVTALSLFAADALSEHIGTTISVILGLPFEAFYLRSTAWRFLSTRDSPSRLIQHIYPPGSWLGTGIRTGWIPILEYSGKVLNCTMIELIAKLQVWQLGCQTALWLGRHRYGWGKL